MTVRAVITSCGAYLPEEIVTNRDLEKRVDTSDEWIVQRTGIRQRHIAGAHETTSFMAFKAAQDAMMAGGIDPHTIDAVLVCTSTPNHTFPSVAAELQAMLDIPPCAAFDLQAVCSGFVYGLSVADMMIRCGQAKRVLLVGAEKFSSILNWEDRTTCVLFGDGAGAVILDADQGGRGTLEDRGVLFSRLYADGRYKDILYVDGGPATTGSCGHVVMQGREVFKHAVTCMADIVSETLAANKLQPTDIDWLVPHQANIRIIESTAKKLGVPMAQVVVTVDRHGNTSAASIPLALNDAVKSGKIKQGDMLLIEALGAGLTWGAALVRF